MVAADPPQPPAGRSGVTFAEIAAHYGLSPRYVAENTRWGRHPDWPTSTGKRGRSNEYDPHQVDAFVQTHHHRPAPALTPDRAYTLTEIAAATGLATDTLYADISRNRWPQPDQTAPDGTRLWLGSTITRTLTSRRRYTPRTQTP
ncbi:helix-turn-helix transcriptional regulator [Streptomyces filamentosus]|uniref:helix-turn-helix transcriptional regulator n=1 Tax=Streptomyces filamentosus TaxID=67294 RepID=UPI0033C09B81